MSLWTCFEVSKTHSKLVLSASWSVSGVITTPTIQKAGGAGVLSLFCRHRTETLIVWGPFSLVQCLSLLRALGTSWKSVLNYDLRQGKGATGEGYQLSRLWLCPAEGLRSF